VTRKSRNVKQLYPIEQEGKIKDANKKLRAQVKTLKNKVKRLEEENGTLKRHFNKSHQYIDEKLSNKSVEEVIDMVKDFSYKETEKGRERMSKQKQSTIFTSQQCPDCGTVEKEGFVITSFASFEMHTCQCGFRTRKNSGEGNKRS
jgi:predicted nuclease with TOPRIM domain